MTETNTTSRPSRQFYVLDGSSGVHMGRCLIACGEDRHALPPVRGWQRLCRFASRADAVDAHPDWEEEIMTS